MVCVCVYLSGAELTTLTEVTHALYMLYLRGTSRILSFQLQLDVDVFISLRAQYN